MEPVQPINAEEKAQGPVKPREEMSLAEIATETGGTLLEHSQTIKHSH